MMRISNYWYKNINFRFANLVFFGLPRGSIELGLEKQSQGFLEVDGPLRLLLGNLGLANLTFDQLKDDGLLKDLLVLSRDLLHLRQVDLTPVGAIKPILRVHASLKTLIDADKARSFQRELQFVGGQNIDQDGGVDSKTGKVGGQLRDSSQQATLVLEDMLLARFPSPFGLGGESAS